jgi:microcystin-dependent protein
MGKLDNLWFMGRRKFLGKDEASAGPPITGEEYTGDLAEIGLIPTGLIVPYAASVVYKAGGAWGPFDPLKPIPPGWLLCNGQAVDRTQYRRLFEAIGTSFGAGDGSTTFNVPNVVDRYVKGVGTTGGLNTPGGTLTHQHGAVGTHTHGTTGSGHQHIIATGAVNGTRSDVQGGGAIGVATDTHGHGATNHDGGHEHAADGGHQHSAVNNLEPPHIHLLYLVKT